MQWLAWVDSWLGTHLDTYSAYSCSPVVCEQPLRMLNLVASEWLTNSPDSAWSIYTYSKEAEFNVIITDPILLRDIELQLCQSRRGETQHHTIHYRCQTGCQGAYGHYPLSIPPLGTTACARGADDRGRRWGTFWDTTLRKCHNITVFCSIIGRMCCPIQ